MRELLESSVAAAIYFRSFCARAMRDQLTSITSVAQQNSASHFFKMTVNEVVEPPQRLRLVVAQPTSPRMTKCEPCLCQSLGPHIKHIMSLFRLIDCLVVPVWLCLLNC